MKGANQCPKCASRRFNEAAQDITGFYGRIIRVCVNCACAWEPFDVADLVHIEEPLGAFRNPCNNCAFRKGSPEQADTEKWAATMADLERGTGFYCHKGVPISPGSERGFDYPDGGKDPLKLRLCRGYLNSVVGPWLRKIPA